MHPFTLFVRMKNVFFSIFFSFASLNAHQSLWMKKNHISRRSSSAICYKNHFTIWLSEANVKRSWKNLYFYSCLYGAAFCSFDWNRNGNKVKRNGIFFYDSLQLRPNSDRVIFQLKIVFSLSSLFVVGIHVRFNHKIHILIHVRKTPLKFMKIHIFHYFFSFFCS